MLEDGTLSAGQRTPDLLRGETVACQRNRQVLEGQVLEHAPGDGERNDNTSDLSHIDVANGCRDILRLDLGSGDGVAALQTAPSADGHQDAVAVDLRRACM